jgi:hypothetical protein
MNIDLHQCDPEHPIITCGPAQLPVAIRDLGVSGKIRFDWNWQSEFRLTKGTIELLRQGWEEMLPPKSSRTSDAQAVDFEVFAVPDRGVFEVPRSVALMFRAYLETILSSPHAWIKDEDENEPTSAAERNVNLRSVITLNMVPACNVNITVLVAELRKLHKTWWREDVRKHGETFAQRQRRAERALVWREFRRPYRTEAQTWQEVDEILPADGA